MNQAVRLLTQQDERERRERERERVGEKTLGLLRERELTFSST
jgi:hypothetical protein